jgi:homoserine O-acetyltransferase
MLTTLKTTYKTPSTPLVQPYQAKSQSSHSFTLHDRFALECGESFEKLTISYSTYGQLNKDSSNVVWVCHALTADANSKEWWPGLIGEDDLYNPKDHFIVCANIIGSAYGTTSPLDCDRDKRYSQFPQVSIRDNVIAFEHLKKHLGIKKIHTLIGGSMGGQQAMEWAIHDSEICQNLILLATSAVMSPWAIAFNQSQRMSIEADGSWSQHCENAASSGLKAARSVALLSYRNDLAYNSTQEDSFNFDKDLRASSYQKYQGEKLVKRFNAYSYHALTRTMDSHDVSRDRGGITQALSSIKANTLVIGVSSDILFPLQESKILADSIPNAHLKTIDSNFGHDGFLIETDKITTCIESFYQSNLNQSSQSVIGMFGLGCVGQGVVELIDNSEELASSNILKSIVIKHEYKSRCIGYDIVGTNASQVSLDKSINTIVEVINDDKQAFRIAQLAIEQDKHFISANKKMIAENLDQIIEWNKSSPLSFLYEAAVAGSIPIIRNLDLYFENRDTQSVKGIINGTSNYILSQMFKHNCLYSDALIKAQELGFAEKDPKADVGGFDAKYKVIILALHAFGCLIKPDRVINLGIQNISTKDIEFAQSRKLSIKQIANIERTDLGLSVSVLPHLIPNNSELAKTDDEDNLIIVKNNNTNFYFKGAGAGGIATGTAILSDLKASKSNYQYNYQIQDELQLDNDKLIHLYISKNDSIQQLEIKGSILEETKDYMIVVIKMSYLIEQDFDGLFIAQI